ncbi:CaiB/BaiF CoA-transferase family protein [Salinarimonas sp.]|uniref:CaiB/BaiF CoA transferase family protein n=1 Tax=Salinarimonas sp. TaxID=2766526 RepID=UPI0032D94CD8
MGPLEGIRVVELGQLIAGPFCGQLLADFGAEVVKVEPPGVGDAMRQWGRPDREGRPVAFSVIARNKKSLTLDLRKPEGQEIVRKLAASADVIVENFRPGTMERWGLGYEALSAINPRLILVRISGFGQTGPYSRRAGFASVCEAMGGLRYISGFPDRPPIRIGLSLGDTLAGVNGAMGALLALQQRARSGKGQVVDSTILESILMVTESLISDYDQGGHVRERHGSALPGIAPSNAYPTRDGQDMIVGANQDSVFRRLCDVIGRPELADDPRFATHRARGENAEALDAVIADWTRRHDADVMIDDLAAAGVPVGLAYRAPEMMDDPHFAAREAIVSVPDARRGGEIAMQNVFPRLSDTPGGVRHAGPALGADTRGVLRDWLGMTSDEIRALVETGVV